MATCLLVCLPAVCVCAQLLVCFCACMAGCVLACLFVLFVWLYIYLSVCLSVCLLVCLSVCVSVCLSISFIETQTVRYISNTKYKQCTEFSFSLMQTTLVVFIVYVLIFFSREDTCQLVEDDSVCLSVC